MSACVKVVHSHPVWLPTTLTWLYNQVRFLPPSVESHVVCLRTANLAQFHVPHIHALESCSSWQRGWETAALKLGFRRHLALLCDTALRENASIVHSHFGNVAWANMRAVKKAHLRHVVTFYGRDISYLPVKREVWKRRYPELFAAADRVLCEGPFMASRVAAFGCPAGKLRVHHLGVPLASIPFRPRRWDGKEPLRVLISGMFREKKGIPYAIEALGRFSRETPVEVTVIGDANPTTATDQVEKTKILAAVASHRLESHVRFLGLQPYAVFLEEAYRNHVFLSPSVTAADGDAEGGVAVSVIEMAASGMPVVATDHCDTREVIEDGVSGFLAAERDVDGLVRHLRAIVSAPERWLDVVTAARRHIEREYDAGVQGERLAEVYREVVGAKSGARV